MPWEPAPGTELGSYLISTTIGRGGMATVYLAEQIALGRKVALKVLSSELADGEEFRRRFVHESRLAAGLEHPGVVPIYDAGEIEGLLFLAMRYVDGTDLKRLLERESTLTPGRTIAILTQVAAALDEAHARGLVHRDVKPANILLERSPGPNGADTAYLADFGLARSVLSVSSHTRPGAVYGTLDYMPPEQIEGRPTDATTDVYSLGCVLYECLVGSPPFHRETVVATLSAHLHGVPSPPSEIDGSLPPGIDEVIATALAKGKADRYPSATALVQAAAATFEADRKRVSIPLRARTPLSNLPAQPTKFVGRRHELEDLAGLLEGEAPRLLTMIGPGGTGKTRLAIESASTLLDRFPDGVFMVSLASLTDPSLVSSAVAKSIGFQEPPGQNLEPSLVEHLRTRRTLLVLDNFEQILPGAAFVADLMAETSDLKILVTSRAPLRLAGEQEYPVRPLAIPPQGRVFSETELSQFEAVALFVARAGMVSPGFALDQGNAAAVSEICARVDGLPLAIELAAARTRLFSPKELLDRMEHRLALLTGGATDLPARQQALRATITWSYDLLSSEDRELFARLSIFSGGWTLEAAEAVCGSPDGSVDVVNGLDSLVQCSLVRREELQGGRLRFAMLETIREYATELLAERGDIDELREGHLQCFLSW